MGLDGLGWARNVVVVLHLLLLYALFSVPCMFAFKGVFITSIV